jgi:hypothetical protein
MTCSATDDFPHMNRIGLRGRFLVVFQQVHERDQKQHLLLQDEAG